MREMLTHPEPVDISLFTAKGEVQHYKNCISLRYDFRNGTRRIKLLSSGQIRQVRDVCIFQINGMEVFLWCSSYKIYEKRLQIKDLFAYFKEF